MTIKGFRRACSSSSITISRHRIFFTGSLPRLAVEQSCGSCRIYIERLDYGAPGVPAAVTVETVNGTEAPVRQLISNAIFFVASIAGPGALLNPRAGLLFPDFTSGDLL